MNKLKISVGVLTLFYAFFIFSYPPSFYNDDSLFLANGIEYYSIIDFSPHFPGYPFIIVLGKIVNYFINDSKFTLFLISSISAILLPLVLFLYVKKIDEERTAFIVFLLSLSSPYLINLSLSMLSDSIGLFFLFLGLYLLELNKTKFSGIVLAISLFSRPSYLILFLIGLIYLFFAKKDCFKDVIIYFFMTSIFFIIFILANNGMLFFYEAKRFIFGHFSLWGIGQNTQISWWEIFFSITNLPYLIFLYAIFKYEKKFILIYIFIFTYFFWIIVAQNPDNMRHMIPIVFLFNIIIARVLVKFKFFLILIILLNIFSITNYKSKVSPIDQIVEELKKEKNRIILSNRSIEILRKYTNHRVFDNYYINSSRYINKKQKTFLITTSRPSKGGFKEFYGRFIGEHKYYLIKN
ncbi:MAG: glycosyltransferase family 39 protein [Arcobacter sp.]|nr:glycosyltransferase family 39 protein [Arcobacter sp.]